MTGGQLNGVAAIMKSSLKRENTQPFAGSWSGTLKVNRSFLEVYLDVYEDGTGALSIYDTDGTSLGSVELLVLSTGAFAGVTEDGAVHSGTLRKSRAGLTGNGYELSEDGRFNYTLQLFP